MAAGDDRQIFGVTDGKAIGTYFEHKFQRHLHTEYRYEVGSSAKGMDFPELLVDMKVTSLRQPQSSCPFKSARQKIYGLGYSLLVFVYEKTDDEIAKTGNLSVLSTVFVDSARTADFQTTIGLRKIVENDGNADDVIAFFQDRFLPVDDVTAQDYLLAHIDSFDSRGSSIYEKRARFAVFGIGPYTFAPWKVAISGLYKNLRFQAIGSLNGKPVVVDDTCYFFPCEFQEEAEFFTSILNSEIAMRFLHSLVFFDSKRAITIDALRRIDLKKVAERLGQRQRAEDYLVNAPFEEGAQQLLLFERRQKYRTSGST